MAHKHGCYLTIQEHEVIVGYFVCDGLGAPGVDGAHAEEIHCGAVREFAVQNTHGEIPGGVFN